MSDERSFDLWQCDNCHLYYHADVRQYPVRVEQRTERVYGTVDGKVFDVYRPVEVLVFCDACYTKAQLPGPR